MPEDLISGEEAGDGDSQADGKQDGSMGLGDGEGEKDVSERIESEDQLDDARPAGEEKKDDDKDCKVISITLDCVQIFCALRFEHCVILTSFQI